MPVTASIAPNASSPAVRFARRHGSVTSPPSPERNESGSGRGHRGRSASTRRPAAWAPMITPCGHARRTVCQPAARQVAQLARHAGRLAVTPVARPGAAAAVVGGAGERAEAGVARRAAVVEARVGQVDDPAARGAQPHAATPPRRRDRGRTTRRTRRSAPPPSACTAKFAPHTISASRSSAPRSSVVIGGSSRPQPRGAWPSKRAPDRPAERLRLRMSPRSLHERVEPARAARTRRRRRTRSGRRRASRSPVFRAAFRLRRSPCRIDAARRSAPPPRGCASRRTVVDHEQLVRNGGALAAERLERHLEIPRAPARRAPRPSRPSAG